MLFFRCLGIPGGLLRRLQSECPQTPYASTALVLSLEDESGIVNIIINPDLFDRNRTACVAAPYVQVKGLVQNTWNVISIRAADVQALALGDETIRSHDFH
jgi:error-prone DNA polymerase